jgi:uncharacterized membrane protein
MTSISQPRTEAAGAEAADPAAERLTFFVDAVIAIAITLLALELPVPEGATNRELLDAFGEHKSEYIAFFISFAVIGAHWRGHHRVFRYVTGLGGLLAPLTMLWLLTQVLTPFATRVLAGDGAFQVRFVWYASVQCVAAIVFILMIWQIQRHRLHTATTPPGYFTNALARTAVLAGAFLVSIPISFVTNYAYLCWVAMPVVMMIVGRRLRRRG